MARQLLVLACICIALSLDTVSLGGHRFKKIAAPFDHQPVLSGETIGDFV